MSKPLLLGMNNPLSTDPEFDLYPYPEGSAGWRLWKLLPEGTTRLHYLEAFDRHNLVRAQTWSPAAARAEAARLLPALDGRVVVVLGTEVRAALDLPKVEPLTFTTTMFPAIGRRRRVAFDWLALPHPSGRNHWYNVEANRGAAREVLTSVMLGDPGPHVDMVREHRARA